jgi:protein-disulfide isomerase
MAGAVVYREVVQGTRQVTGQGSSPTGRYYEEWKSLARSARYVGDSTGPVQLIEFTDLECPACKGFHENTLRALRAKLGARISIAIVHLPLVTHRFARQAAHAAECAADQESFESFINVAFAKQDSFGLKTWQSYAAEAGVPDLSRFESCTRRGVIPALVDSGLVAADRLGFHATPTVLVNGWRVPSPSITELERVVAEVEKDRPPYPMGPP